MYAIPWFVTYLATKMPSRDIILDFWERIVKKNEPLFIYFFLTAFVLQHEKQLLGTDMVNLPIVMANLEIKTYSQLDELW
jgi:hypothetical protein